MIFLVICNVLIICTFIGIDLYKHQFRRFNLTTFLLAITLNALISFFVLGQYFFISQTILTFLIIWLSLAFMLKLKGFNLYISKQKFFFAIIGILFSISNIISFSASDDSYYMSVPYIAPAIFIFGAILLFVSTFREIDTYKGKFSNKVKDFILIGNIFIILSLPTLTILTPFWYMPLITHGIFIGYIFWTKLFSSQKINKSWR